MTSASTLTRPIRWRSDLSGLAAIFLRLGLTSFGGPAAHVALMREEFVRRRGWLDDHAYVDMIGAANLIPGPTSTEVAMHVGHRRAGWPGLIVAGLAFILPSVLIVAALAWLYVEQGSRPEVGAILAGVAPIVVAVIAVAGASIGRTAIRTRSGAVIAVAAVAGSLAGIPEIALLLGLGAVALLAAETRGRAGGMATAAFASWPRSLPSPDAPPSLEARGAVAALGGVAIGSIGALAIFVEFLKIGAVLFGSGYLLVALLRAELVDGLGWITTQQLLDAVAVGQATPGPLFSTATFIGYVAGGPAGAVAATVGIFLPAFIAVAVSIPILDRLRRSRRARAFLDGVNAAAVGLLGLVALQLGLASIRDALGLVSALVALVLLWRGVGAAWLIAAGAAIGLIRLAVPT